MRIFQASRNPARFREWFANNDETAREQVPELLRRELNRVKIKDV